MCPCYNSVGSPYTTAAKNFNLSLITSKQSGKSKLRDFLQNNWPELVINVTKCHKRQQWDPALQEGFPSGSAGKESTCNAGDTGDKVSIPRWGISPGGGNGNPLQYSCLKNPMDRGAWLATVQRDTKSRIWLSRDKKKMTTKCNMWLLNGLWIYNTYTHTQYSWGDWEMWIIIGKWMVKKLIIFFHVKLLEFDNDMEIFLGEYPFS